jgi:hypothetical protein
MSQNDNRRIGQGKIGKSSESLCRAVDLLRCYKEEDGDQLRHFGANCFGGNLYPFRGPSGVQSGPTVHAVWEAKLDGELNWSIRLRLGLSSTGVWCKDDFKDVVERGGALMDREGGNECNARKQEKTKRSVCTVAWQRIKRFRKKGPKAQRRQGTQQSASGRMRRVVLLLFWDKFMEANSKKMPHVSAF